jgi:hypothetical protein
VAIKHAGTAAGEADDEFFVGYLPLPPRLAAGMKRMVAALLALGAVVAGAAAGLVNDPGAGAWSDEAGQAWEGELSLQPYPMLRVPAPAGHWRTMLLVGEGKVGVAERARDFDGRWVRLRGTRLERDGRAMIEVASADDAIERIDVPRDRPPSDGVMGLERVVDIRGEIIDPKCYLGAMKPGEGKTHKACAALCLRGGIPPMFVTRSESGEPVYYLLLDDAGEPLEGQAIESVLPFVGDFVRLRGRAVAAGDMNYLKVNSVDIRRE